MPDLDRAHADKLSQIPKVINEQVRWQVERNGHRLKVRVLAPDVKETMELRGYIGKTNHSFVLMFQQLPIRRYDHQGRHTSPNGETVVGPHKHTWDKIYEDAYSYVPNDIDPNADVNEQFLQFLIEQNIKLNAGYQYLMQVT